MALGTLRRQLSCPPSAVPAAVARPRNTLQSAWLDELTLCRAELRQILLAGVHAR